MLILILGVAALAGFVAFVVALFGCCIGCLSLVGAGCSCALVCLCVSWVLVRVVEHG